jgi:hypothetical protein
MNPKSTPNPAPIEDPVELERLVSLCAPPAEERARAERQRSAPLDAVRAQVLALAADPARPKRSQVRARNRLIVLVMIAVPLLAFAALGAIRPSPRPSALVLTTASGSLLVAVLVAARVFHRGRSMLAPASGWLLAAVIATPALLLFWKVGVTFPYDGMMLEWRTRPGMRCLSLSCLLTAVPLLGALALRRGSEPTHARLVGAALGASVGAFTWVLVDLWCPVGHVPHLLLGHLLPLLLAIALGFTLGQPLLGVAAARR